MFTCTSGLLSLNSGTQFPFPWAWSGLRLCVWSWDQVIEDSGLTLSFGTLHLGTLTSMLWRHPSSAMGRPMWWRHKASCQHYHSLAKQVMSCLGSAASSPSQAFRWLDQQGLAPWLTCERSCTKNHPSKPLQIPDPHKLCATISVHCC
jgi:hypothetical protein